MTKEAKNNRTLFEVFLKKKLPSDGDPSKYSRSLDNKIKRFYIDKLRQEFASLFELTDENDVFKIKQDLAAHPSLVYRPGRRGDSRIEGLDWYLEYLQSMVSQDVKSEEHEGQQKEKRIRMATPKMEGKHIKRERTVIQRNPDARRKCIEHFGCPMCSVRPHYV